MQRKNDQHFFIYTIIHKIKKDSLLPKRSRIRLDEEKILRIGELAGLGLSNDQIAECLDMSRSSFYKCIQKMQTLETV